ncbi:MAG TPA: DUF4142 domain-containing protein [Xanthobacteraceae bacterium]|jgi:putative membrane protein
MNLNSVIIAAAVAAALGAGTAAAQAQNSKATQAEKSFMTEAIQGDLAEVEMGKLAQQKGTSQDVKQLGSTLVTDHGANLDKAKSVAQSAGVTPPSAPSAKQKAMYDRMSKLSGEQFDKQFAKEMVQDHQKDIRGFEKQSKSSGPVGEFAKDTLPTLRKHLEMAQSLSRSTTGSSR